MNVLLIGSGGREHAIAKKLSESKRLKKFYCIQGNPGIAELTECVDISLEDIDKIVEYAKLKSIDLIVCGPENPLVAGLADEAANCGIPVFGPKKSGAILEGSKIFSKQFMFKNNIPTSSFKNFNNYEEANNYLNNKLTFPIVIKADGLAAGKGVKIVKTKDEAKKVIHDFMINKIHGNAGESIIIEDFLLGEEMSFFYITDGNTFLPLLPAKDYKRALDNDEGENTGGMGSYAPHTSITDKIKTQIEMNILKNIKKGFKNDNIDYRGVLYIGLMINGDDINVLEFNCRFGDPETQVILPLIDNDLLEIMYATAKCNLESHSIKWKNDYCACVVIASGGYPEKYKKGLKINFDTNPFNYIHAGTKYHNKNIVTNGGRVLNAVYTASSKLAALQGAYKLVEKVHFEGSFYRKDIGK